eukprot:1260271-Pleurochrysis_carterae.AAC.1
MEAMGPPGRVGPSLLVEMRPQPRRERSAQLPVCLRAHAQSRSVSAPRGATTEESFCVRL